MAEKKFGLGTALLIGAAAAAVAGGVASYIKRAEIKKLAEDIIARVKPAEDNGDEIGDWDIRSGMEPEAADAADVNIVDSGISLESVENPEDSVEAEAESGSVAAGEAGEEPEAEEAAEESGDETEQSKKKTWFWSK